MNGVAGAGHPVRLTGTSKTFTTGKLNMSYLNYVAWRNNQSHYLQSEVDNWLLAAYFEIVLKHRRPSIR